MLGQLGCAQYSARVVTRGALAVVWEEIPFTSLAWGRVLDDTSTASVPVDGVIPGCAAQLLLAQTRTWQHEVVIYRAGSPVWCGPLVTRKANGTGVILSARDRTAWWDRRYLHADHNFTQVELATIFQAYFDDAMGADPVAGFTCAATATGILGSRQVAALDHVMSGDELRAVAQIGIDYTAVGFSLIAGGRTIPTGRLPVITDDHLVVDPDVEDGAAKGNRFVVTGGQPVDAVTGQTIDGPKVFGEASDATLRALDGLLEVSASDDQILDTTSATAAAASALALNGQGGAIISALQLGANAPMTIDQIVPGAIIDVELSRPAIPVSGLYRISQVDVSVDGNSGEVVTITVQPVGTT
jgi:hypothetical protein